MASNTAHMSLLWIYDRMIDRRGTNGGLEALRYRPTKTQGAGPLSSLDIWVASSRINRMLELCERIP